MERQTLGDCWNPETGDVAPLGIISSACGPFLDVDIRQEPNSLFSSVAQVWAKALKLEILSDPSVTARFAAAGVKAFVWPIGFSARWDDTDHRILEFDSWVRYVIDQSTERLRSRFLYYIGFEAISYPQLAKLSAKTTSSDQLWTSVMQLLSSFFPSDEMSISSWVKLEFTLANPDLLLFTQSPEHSAKPLPEWVQYVLHQRKETQILAKTQRHVDTAGGVTVASASDHAEYHLTEPFLKFTSMIRKIMDAPNVTSFEIRVAVMSSGLPLLQQWICGLPTPLSGHAIYKELAPHKLPGGKTMYTDLSELVGEVITQYCELDMPLKNVVKYRFPVEALKDMLAGSIFNLDAVLDDFN